MKYGLNLSWNKLCEDEGALAIVRQHLPVLEKMIQMYPAAARISIRAAQRYAPASMLPKEKVDALERALRDYGKAKGLTEKESAKVARYQAMAKQREARSVPVTSGQIMDAFFPGKPWLDIHGQRIQAHAGGIYYENGIYYWYGENKEFTPGNDAIWTWGIRIYRSVDLYNWEDLGLLVPPVLDNPDSNLFPEKLVDRPHIIKCEGTGKYVMWIKLSGAEGCFTVLQADTLLGPYHIVREDYYPLEHGVGDFDLVVDEDTGKAYLYMDTDHKRVACFALTEDYLEVEKEISSQYEDLQTPFTREGIAMFQRHEKKYMITSGRSGYTPNQSDYAMAENWTDVFASMGDPHINDDSLASFNSQISQVFKVPGKKDLYIAIADRWMPEHLLDHESAMAVRRSIASRYMPEAYQATEADHALFRARPDLERANTAIADYVWLPIRFDGEKVCIEWHDSWRLEDYE